MVRGKVYSIKDITEALGDRVISVVAEKTGLGIETLYQIARGRAKGMRLSTYTILVNYLFGNADDGE